MSDIPERLRYTRSHEWAQLEEDIVIVGITRHAVESLGEIVFVELPDVGRVVSAADEIAVVESVKAASDLYAPVSGEVVMINKALIDAPELVNKDPYKLGWFFKIKVKDASEFNVLLKAADYAGNTH